MKRKRRRPEAVIISAAEIEAAVEQGVAATAAERASIKADMVTVTAAATLLGVDEVGVLNLAFEDRLSLATVTPLGRALFMLPGAIHAFVADPDSRTQTKDLGMLYDCPPRPTNGYCPAPHCFTPEPTSPVTLRTLRVLRSEVLRVREELIATPLPWVVLQIDLRTREARYRGFLLGLRPTPFRLIALLAESPGTRIPHETLVKKASKHVGACTCAPSRWAKDNKAFVMRALRRLAANGQIKPAEAETLISAHGGALILNLGSDQVRVIR